MGLLQSIQKGIKCVCCSVVNLVISFVIVFFSLKKLQICIFNWELAKKKKKAKEKGTHLNVHRKEIQRASRSP